MDRTRREFVGLGVTAAAGLLSGCAKDKQARGPVPAGGPPRLPASLPPAVSADRFLRRRADLAARMRESAFDLVLITPGASLTYLTGASPSRSERLIAWVLTKEGRCRCLAPAFEKERLVLSGLPSDMQIWEETEDPVPLLAGILSSGTGVPRIAVEGTTWFDTLASLSRSIPGAKIASATPLLSSLRMRKDPEEIALIQAAVDVTRAAIRETMREARQGMTEEDLLGRAMAIAAAAGASLEGMVQFGSNSAIPHAGPGQRRLRSADVVLFDLVSKVHGYHSDISRTFAFGQPSPRFQQVYRLVKQAQEEGIRAVRPGVRAGDVDEAARSVIRRKGFGPQFTHRLGHGLGLEVHEAPYLVGGNDLLLEEGMAVTVEPGVYLRGEFGVRLEDDVLVTSTGAKVLSADPASPAA